MKFVAEYTSNIAAGAKADADAVRALRTEMGAAKTALGELDKARGPGGGTGAPKAPSGLGYGSFGYGGAGARVVGDGPDLSKGLAAAAAEQRAAREKAKASKEAARERAKELALAGTRGAVGSVAGGARMAMGATLAAAGAGGAADLARLAMGYRGMAQLQALGMRTQLQMRGLFRGVDSAPAVRAADRFLNSLFAGTSTSGKALAGLAERGFGGIFRLLEKAQPYATAFFQGMILGAMEAENAYLSVRLALLPYTDALEQAIGPTERIEFASKAGAIALGALALGAAGASAPFIAMVGAIALVIDQYRKLKAEMDAGGAEAVERAKLPIGSAEAEAAYGIHVDKGPKRVRITKNDKGQYVQEAMPDPAAGAAAGEASGALYADGVAKGVASGAPKVGEAGKRLADGVDQGFRAGAKIQSPSRVAEESASYIPAGTVRGLDKGAGAVQAAADRSLVPQMPGAGARGGAGGLTVSLGGINVVVQGGGKPTEDMETAVRRVFNVELRALFVSLGISPDLGVVVTP